MSKQSFANLQGYGAILLWSFSAFFTGLTKGIPPLLLAGLASLVGFIFYVLLWLKNPGKLKNAFKQPWQIWVLFFVAIVVYRGFYFSGLKLAPIVETNLLNYLWPLLIVIFSALFDRQKLPPKALFGAVCCFAGVICIGLSKKDGVFSFELGHLLAIAAAITWAIYSVLTRRFAATPTDMIGIMHLVGFIFFMTLHSLFDAPIEIRNLGLTDWTGIAGLGLAQSLGYSLWDKAMTNGHRHNIAVAAYYTPLLSTLWLFLLGGAVVTFLVWIAAAFIIGGALLARLNTPLIQEPES